MDDQAVAPTIPGDEVVGPIQLQDAYLYDAKVTREAVPPTGEEELTLEPRVRGWSLSDDRLSMLVVLGAVISHRFRPEAVVQLDLTVAGQFASQTPIDDESARAFAPVNGLLLLWPYLRGYVGQLSAAMQVDLPALPVLSVQSVVEHMRGTAPEVDEDQPASPHK